LTATAVAMLSAGPRERLFREREAAAGPNQLIPRADRLITTSARGQTGMLYLRGTMNHRMERDSVVHKARDIIMSLAMTVEAVRRHPLPDEQLVVRMNDDLDRLENVFEQLDLFLDEQLEELYRRRFDQESSRSSRSR
jgi:hypothetical protein